MKLLEVNYLRSYAILSIVVWHCFVCPLAVWRLIDQTSLTEAIFVLSKFVIPDANMPLFTFISGYLFSYLYRNNTEKYGMFVPFLKVKIKRLVIPFLVIGTLVNITMPERFLYMIPDGEGSHLWFCMMLFWCFIIRWIVININNKLISVLAILLSMAAIVFSGGSNWNLPGFPFSLFGIRHAVFFYFYFVMGDILYKNRDKIIEIVGRRDAGVFLLIFTVTYVFWVMCSSLKIKYVSFLQIISNSAFFIIICYLWVMKLISAGWLKRNKYIETFCIYSFGIYVFHEWLSWGLYHQPFFFELFEKYTIAYAFVFTIFDFAASFVLTHFSLKTKIGRYLLL